MANIFFAADYHFGHKNTFELFKLENGAPLRPFTSLEEMHETIVERHNFLVKPEDKIYMLGDIAFHQRHLEILNRMNGTKILIKGNHDNLKLSHYAPYFKDIRGSHQMTGILMTHIPVHPESLARWGFNIHGHLHANRVRDEEGNLDKRYLCVSVEQIDYRPLSLEEVLQYKGPLA